MTFWNLWPVVLSSEGCWGLLPGRAHITSFLLLIGRCLWSKQLTLSHHSDQGRHPFRPVRAPRRFLLGRPVSQDAVALPPPQGDMAGQVRLFSV